jgi:hypothetical protein
MGETLAAAGDLSKARRTFLDALRQGLEVGSVPLALDALIGLAYLQGQDGEAEHALEISIFVSDHLSSTQETKDRARHLRVQLETQLTPQQVQRACASAQDRPFEKVVESALRRTP